MLLKDDTGDNAGIMGALSSEGVKYPLRRLPPARP